MLPAGVRTSRRALRKSVSINTWKERVIPLTARGHATAADRKEKNVVYCPIPDVELPNEGIVTTIFNRASKWSHLDSIECGVTGRKYTYGGLIDRALRWGAVLSPLLKTSRTLAILSPNAPEFQPVVLGAMAVGAAVTTINFNYTEAEIAKQLADSDAEVAVVDPSMEAILTSAIHSIQKTIPIFVNGASSKGNPNLREILEDTTKPFAEVVETPLDSMAALLYSSGTTGKPKGVAISHRAITSNMAMFTSPFFFPYLPPTDNQHDTVVGVMPFYHIYGMYVVNMITLYLGGKIVSLPAFTPNDFLNVIRDHKIRVLHLVPPMLNFLTKSPVVTSDDLASVRVAMCAAAPVPPSAAQEFKEKAPNPLLFQEGFGMTEALGTHMTPMNEEKIGWCGKPVPNTECKVVCTETGEALPEGERGEMCIRSPSLMSYYHKNPEATASTIDPEGWLHTGDVAIHEDGFFSIVDRIKELIKVKGFQVSPSELEELLLQHPGVVDAGVVGVPDERAGELPRAYIVRRQGVTIEDIHSHLEGRVADHKQLKGGVRFLEELPKNATGKLLRRELKELTAKDI